MQSKQSRLQKLDQSQSVIGTKVGLNQKLQQLYQLYQKPNKSYQMSFGNLRGNAGCNCTSINQKSFARMASPFGNTRRPPIQQDHFHNHLEMEDILMQERNKFRQIRERFETQLDSQRKLRLTLQNKLVKLKEEFVKKDVAISDLQFKQNSCLNQNQSLSIENQRLRNQLMMLQDASRAKIYELDIKLNTEVKNAEQAAARYDSEFQRFKKEGLQYIQNLTQEYQKKIKNLDQKAKNAEGSKRGLNAEIKKLSDLILSNQLNFDTQLRQTVNRLRDDESRKTQQIVKSFQQRLKAMEESKQALARKNQQLNKGLQQKQRLYQDLRNQKFQEIHRLNQDVANITNQKQQINSAYERLKVDFSSKTKPSNAYIDASSSSDAAFLKQQLEAKRRQLEGLKDVVRELKQSVKQSQNQTVRQKQQWVEKAGFYQNQSKKYRQLYERLCQKLKMKINQTINTACYTRQ